MQLKPGAQLGPYEILSPLGKGGMGEVWRARDPRLGREVAIKTSNDQFSDRFEKEARAIAALNHPNICTLYDVGPNYLVMELIEGPTLADRIHEGAIPLEEALAIARQIAEALEAAHEKGIVHRDLKPGNVKIRPDGSVKVLDFGLAKAVIESGKVTSDSPTLMHIPTQMGVILGTAAYMPPEQARGKEVDKRADIWSFGVVLHEMLTGKRLFQGEDLTETLAAVVKTEPDLSGVPTQVKRLLEKCLQKDPRKRLRDIGDVWELLALDRGGTGPGRFATSGWLVAGVCALAAVVIAVLWLREETPVPRPVRFTVNAPDGTTMAPTRPGVSPNGEYIIFAARNADGQQLYAHSLASGQSRPLPFTKGCTNVYWGPDSQSFIAVCRPNLLRLDLAGSGPRPLRLSFDQPGYTSWGPEGLVTVTLAGDAIYRLNTDGSVAAKLNVPPATAYPSWTFGARWLLYNEDKGRGNVDVHLAAPDGKADRVLLKTRGRVLPAGEDWLLVREDNALMALPFDSKKGSVVGAAVPVVDTIGGGEGTTSITHSASSNGVLAFRPGIDESMRQLTWFDREGRKLGNIGEPGNYAELALSPDDSKVAVTVPDRNPDIRVLDPGRGTDLRLTFDPGPDYTPVWSPDSKRIAFSSNRRGRHQIYTRDAGGAGDEEMLHEAEGFLRADGWSQDGRISYQETNGSTGDAESSGFLAVGDRKPTDVVPTKPREARKRLSPNGKWRAYMSFESDPPEVYVATTSGGTGKWQISSGGASDPQWRADGKELFYLKDGNPTQIMAVDIVEKDGGLQVGVPHPLFAVRLPGGLQRGRQMRWAVSHDGKKFLAITPVDQKPVNSFEVIVNWPSLVRKK